MRLDSRKGIEAVDPKTLINSNRIDKLRRPPGTHTKGTDGLILIRADDQKMIGCARDHRHVRHISEGGFVRIHESVLGFQGACVRPLTNPQARFIARAGGQIGLGVDRKAFHFGQRVGVQIYRRLLT